MVRFATLVAQRGTEIDLDLTLNGIIALGIGVLILLFPKLLNYLVAGYLIAIGIIEILDVRI